MDLLGLAAPRKSMNLQMTAEAAETATVEARAIATRLRCQPLLDRTADLVPAKPPKQA